MNGFLWGSTESVLYEQQVPIINWTKTEIIVYSSFHPFCLLVITLPNIAHSSLLGTWLPVSFSSWSIKRISFHHIGFIFGLVSSKQAIESIKCDNLFVWRLNSTIKIKWNLFVAWVLCLPTIFFFLERK